MVQHTIVLDMDVGIDDAVAIAFLAQQPNVEIMALGSVHGNIDAPTAALNALRTLEQCGRNDVPVAVGAALPLAVPLILATHVHGADGLGDTHLPAPQGQPTVEHAVDQLMRLAAHHPGKLDLLAVGPLTNLALGLQRDPLLLTRFRSVVIMGGAGVEPPSGTPLLGYDANTDHDPDAADAVFAAPGNKIMVGIDVTIPTILAGADLEQLERSTTPAGSFVAKVLPFYLDVYAQRLGFRGCSMHDPLAAGVLLDPTLISAAVDGPVEVVPSERGFRAVLLREPRDPNRPHTRVVTAVDSRRFLDWLVAALA